MIAGEEATIAHKELRGSGKTSCRTWLMELLRETRKRNRYGWQTLQGPGQNENVRLFIQKAGKKYH